MPNKSIAFSTKAVDACKRTGNKIDLKSAYSNLSEAYELAGDYRAALKPISTLKGILTLESEELIDADECIKLITKLVLEIDENIIDTNNMME